MGRYKMAGNPLQATIDWRAHPELYASVTGIPLANITKHITGMTYDCQNPAHVDGVDLPDELFPTPEEVKQGLDPERCRDCQKK